MYSDAKKVDVLLFLEHKDRELEVICSIAKLLRSKYDLSVAIASTLFDPVIAALRVRPKVVVTPSLGIGPGSIDSTFYQIYGKGITYVNLNWEQVLSPLNRAYRKPRDDFSKSVLHHFAWGYRFKDYLAEHGVNPERIYVTGKPSLALLKAKARRENSDLRQALSKRFELDATLRWVFMPMTCLHAFSSDYHTRSRIAVGGYDEATAVAHKNYVSETLNMTFQWLSRIDEAATDRDFVIILRPHPSISVSQYEERFNRVVGHVPRCVRISKELNAHQWLLVADSCFTNYSSLVLDANYIGLPSFILEPKPFPSFLVTDWFSHFTRLTSLKSLTQAIATPVAFNKKDQTIVDADVDTSLDGVSESARRLADLAFRSSFSKPSPLGFAKSILAAPRRPIGSILRRLAVSTGLNPMQILKPGIAVDYFSRNEVVEHL